MNDWTVLTDGGAATLHVQLTDEGIIADLIDADGEIVATWGATAQELADDYTH